MALTFHTVRNSCFLGPDSHLIATLPKKLVAGFEQDGHLSTDFIRSSQVQGLLSNTKGSCIPNVSSQLSSMLAKRGHREQELNRIKTAQRRMMRRMVGVTLLDRRTNEWLHGTVKLQDIRVTWIKRKWKWAQKIANMKHARWTKIVSEWRPWNRYRAAGRPRARWKNDLTAGCGENWMSVAVRTPDIFRQSMQRHIEMI